MHMLNASSESVVSSLGSTTVHWSVQLGSKWLSLPATSSICICVYTSHKIQKCGNAQIQTDDSHLETPSIPMITPNVRQKSAVTGRLCVAYSCPLWPLFWVFHQLFYQEEPCCLLCIWWLVLSFLFPQVIAMHCICSL